MGVAWIFSLVSRTNSRRTQFLIAIKMIASNASRYRESFCWVPFETDLTSIRYNEHPYPFYTGASPPPSSFRISVLVKIARCLISYWHSCLTITALNARSHSPSSIPDQGHCVVLLGKTLYSHGASLHPGVLMGTSKFNAGSNPGRD